VGAPTLKQSAHLDLVDNRFKIIMKSLLKAKTSFHSTDAKDLTLGDLIAATYGAGGKEAPGLKFSNSPWAANVH